mmetsp:Transcript_110446/g.219562  ORF Transcript_110446/g.219562 Transcript_110446/m.219562 type:complete len:85 (-) Transcript_110446:39-293(-)
MVGSSSPVDFLHGHRPWMACIDYLTVNGPVGALLHLGEVEGEQTICPAQQLTPGNKKGTIHAAHGRHRSYDQGSQWDPTATPRG